MKRLFGIFILMFSVFLIAGCGLDKTEEVVDHGKIDGMPNSNIEKNKEEFVAKKEYKMEINMEMTKEDKKLMEGKYKIYKKDGNTYTEIVKFGGEQMQEIPIKPVATLSKGGKSYTQMEISGAKQRFLSENIGLENQFGLFDDKMFDANVVKEELENVANVEKSDEEFDGNNVSCHSFSEEGGKVKLCINEKDGYVAYIQSEFNGEMTYISVSNFDDNVEDSVFETPKDAKPISEIGKMMMGDEFEGMMKNTEGME